MTATISPEQMDGLEWFDRTTQITSEVIPPFTLLDIDRWRDWAANARRAQPEVPDPYQFADWRVWADRFNQVMSMVK